MAARGEAIGVLNAVPIRFRGVIAARPTNDCVPSRGSIPIGAKHARIVFSRGEGDRRKRLRTRMHAGRAVRDATRLGFSALPGIKSPIVGGICSGESSGHGLTAAQVAGKDFLQCGHRSRLREGAPRTTASWERDPQTS